MKGITFVQAFQYWTKMFAICVPIFILCNVFGGYNANLEKIDSSPKAIPQLNGEPPLVFKEKKDAPLNVLPFSAVGKTTITFPSGAVIAKISPVRKPEPGEDPMPDAVSLKPNDIDEDKNPVIRLQPGDSFVSQPYYVTNHGMPVVKDGQPVKTAPKLEF